MKIVSLEEIKAVLPSLDLIPAIEAGFVAYSRGQAVVPPVGELLLDQGEVHIKYGYLRRTSTMSSRLPQASTKTPRSACLPATA